MLFLLLISYFSISAPDNTIKVKILNVARGRFVD
jgi:hypothetical protein